MTTGTPTSSLVSNTIADNATQNSGCKAGIVTLLLGIVFILEHSDLPHLRRNVSGQLLDDRAGSYLVLYLARRWQVGLLVFPEPLFRLAPHHIGTRSLRLDVTHN